MEKLKTTAVSPEILAEIKRLHFLTNRLAEQTLSGRYRSAFRGRGIEFEEVREYFPGDDIRSIDWKVTARSRKPYIKSFREERELSVMLAVDVSASTLTGTRMQLRDRVIAQVGAVLTLIAVQNNDKVGLLTYSDALETYHPPRRARSAVWRILHEVLSPAGSSKRTDLSGMLSFLNRTLKRSSVVFILSDFLAAGYERELSALGRRHDVTAVTVSDPADHALPQVGIVALRHPETGEEILVDSSDPAFSKHYRESSHDYHVQLQRLFARCGVGHLELKTDEPFIIPLRRFFDARRSQSQAVRPRRIISGAR